MTTQPFRDAVRGLNRRGVRFMDMAIRSNEARSSSWFNNLANGKVVSPPTPEIVPDLARLLERTPEQVAAMVAEDWYGVRVDETSPRVRHLAPAIDNLSDEDFETVDKLITRFVRLAQLEDDEGLSELMGGKDQ
ncbi:hypothetical protein [Jiangella ureilytica]|nr:hypothetical protein [Jiangella ureilytica]